MISFRANVVRLFPAIIVGGHLRAFIAAVAFAGGICCTTLIFGMLSISPNHRIVLFIAAAACMFAGSIVKEKRWCLAAFFTAGLLTHGFHQMTQQMIDQAMQQMSKEAKVCHVRIITPPAPQRDGYRYLAKVNNTAGTERAILDGKIFSCFGRECPVYGSEIVLSGACVPGALPANRYDFNEYAFFGANGIAGKISVDTILGNVSSVNIVARMNSVFRTWLTGVLKLYEHPHHRALIRASFTGEKSFVAPEITRIFLSSGLIHLLALSGFNAAILLAAVYFLLFLLPLPAFVKHAFALAVVWVYFILIGPIPSLTRAVIMATMVILAIMTQRKNYPLQTLGLAALVWLVFSPSSLFQPGFQLSYAATFGILTLHPLIMKSLPLQGRTMGENVVRIPLNALSVSIAASLATLPVLLHHFGTFSFYGIVANVPAIPLMSGAMWFFFAALLVNTWLPLLGKALISCSAMSVESLLSVARFSEKIPFASVNLPAPWIEITVSFIVLLIIILSVADNRRRTVVLMAVPVFLCMIPVDFLVRRMVTPVEAVFFAPLQKESVCAVRLPSGDAWIFGKGASASLPGRTGQTLVNWERHRPLMFRKHFFYCNSAGQMLGPDGRFVPGSRPVDSIMVQHAASGVGAKFFPKQSLLRITWGKELMEFTFPDSVVCLRRAADGALVKQCHARPVRFMIGKKGCRAEVYR